MIPDKNSDIIDGIRIYDPADSSDCWGSSEPDVGVGVSVSSTITDVTVSLTRVVPS